MSSVCKLSNLPIWYVVSLVYNFFRENLPVPTSDVFLKLSVAIVTCFCCWLIGCHFLVQNFRRNCSKRRMWRWSWQVCYENKTMILRILTGATKAILKTIADTIVFFFKFCLVVYWFPWHAFLWKALFKNTVLRFSINMTAEHQQKWALSLKKKNESN